MHITIKLFSDLLSSLSILDHKFQPEVKHSELYFLMEFPCGLDVMNLHVFHAKIQGGIFSAKAAGAGQFH